MVAGGVHGLADRAPILPIGSSSKCPEDDLKSPGAISAPSQTKSGPRVLNHIDSQSNKFRKLNNGNQIKAREPVTPTGNKNIQIIVPPN